MPIFELQKEGKSFEVDAPDMQSAISALGQEPKSISGFLSNFATNAGKVAGNFYQAASQPVETAKGLGKLGIGMAQEFIPGQQQYETQYADPFYKQIGRDVGFSRGPQGIQWSPSQLAQNAYERPVDLALDVGMVAAPGETLPGRLGRTVQTVNRVTNPISATGRAVTSVAKRAVTPFPARAGAAAANDVLANEGVRLTAGQATGNKALKYAESELGGTRTSGAIDVQNEQFTRAASHRIGEDTPHLDPAALRQSYRRIGNNFNVIGGRNTVAPSPQLAQEAHQALAEYQNTVPPNAHVPAVAGYAQTLINASGQAIPGRVYIAWRSRLARLARNTNDPQLKAVYGDLREALDNAAERSMSPADVEAFRTARRQYRNFLVLENAMATGGQETAAGLLTPGKLEQAAASGPNRRWYAQGLSDFTDLAKAGKVGMTKMPESGTSARVLLNTIPAAIGAVAGGAASGGTLGGVAGAIGGRMAAGRVLMSRPVQAYLRNQLAPAGMTRGGRVAGSLGRAITNATQRQESLKHAENVLSPQVLDHIKKSQSTRGPLNEWLKARNSGEGVGEATQMLASAITKELKITDPTVYDRIIQELNQTQGP